MEQTTIPASQVTENDAAWPMTVHARSPSRPTRRTLSMSRTAVVPALTPPANSCTTSRSTITRRSHRAALAPERSISLHLRGPCSGATASVGPREDCLPVAMLCRPARERPACDAPLC